MLSQIQILLQHTLKRWNRSQWTIKKIEWIRYGIQFSLVEAKLDDKSKQDLQMTNQRLAKWQSSLRKSRMGKQMRREQDLSECLANISWISELTQDFYYMYGVNWRTGARGCIRKWDRHSVRSIPFSSSPFQQLAETWCSNKCNHGWLSEQWTVDRRSQLYTHANSQIPTGELSQTFKTHGPATLTLMSRIESILANYVSHIKSTDSDEEAMLLNHSSGRPVNAQYMYYINTGLQQCNWDWYSHR